MYVNMYLDTAPLFSENRHDKKKKLSVGWLLFYWRGFLINIPACFDEIGSGKIMTLKNKVQSEMLLCVSIPVSNSGNDSLVPALETQPQW